MGAGRSRGRRDRVSGSGSLLFLREQPVRPGGARRALGLGGLGAARASGDTPGGVGRTSPVSELWRQRRAGYRHGLRVGDNVERIEDVA